MAESEGTSVTAVFNDPYSFSSGKDFGLCGRGVLTTATGVFHGYIAAAIFTANTTVKALELNEGRMALTFVPAARYVIVLSPRVLN